MIYPRQETITIENKQNVPFNYYLMREDKTDIILTSQAVEGDEILNVSAGHGFTVGNMLTLWEYGAGFQFEVKSVNVNAITIAERIRFKLPFTIANAKIIRGSAEMNINGSITPQTFKFKFYDGGFPSTIHLTGARISLQHTAEGDSSKFGGITALSNGFILEKLGDLFSLSIGNYQKNQDFSDKGGIVSPNSKAAGGNYGTDINFSLNEENIYNVIAKLFSTNNDEINGIIRDNLSALLRFRICLLGYFEGFYQ